MRRALPFVLCAIACLASPAPTATAPLDAELKALASLPGEPAIVSAAGMTRSEAPLLTIENPSAFDPASTRLRLVIVGGLDGDPRSAQAVIDAVRWLKRGAPQQIRDRWIVSALPMADPDGHARREAVSLPAGQRLLRGSRNSRRAATSGAGSTYQAPDLVIELRGEAVGRRSA